MKFICGVIDFAGTLDTESTVSAMCQSLDSPLRPATMQRWNSGRAAMATLDFAPQFTVGPNILTTASGNTLCGDLRLDGTEIPVTSFPQKLRPVPREDEAQTAAAILEQPDPNAARTLYGDFACALWKPGSDELLLVRDAMGVRPLFVATTGSAILFASLARGILASGLVERRLNLGNFAAELTRDQRAQSSLFHGIEAVEAGTVWHWKAGSAARHRYWKPTSQPQRHTTPEQAAAELRFLVEDAIQSRVPQQGPVGAHLSGGLDSSTVAILAARTLSSQNRRLAAYSFLPDPRDTEAVADSEMPYVAAVLEQEPSIDSVPIHASENSELDARCHIDALVPLQSDHPENAVCNDAMQRGISVILSGWGGDEGITYNGRASLADALVHGRWGYLAREVRSMRRLRGLSYKNILAGNLVGPILGESRLKRLKRLLGRGDEDRKKFYLPSLIRNMQKEVDIQTVASVRKNQLALLQSPHIPNRNVKWATFGAHYGIAFVFPFLDRRLVEFSLSLPPVWQLRDGYRRRVFRDAMAGILPERIRLRHDKLQPFPPSSPRAKKLNAAQSLARFEDLAAHPTMAELFDISKVRAAITEQQDEDKPGHKAAIGEVFSAGTFLKSFR